MFRLLFWLTVATFAVGTEGFVIAGILPAVAGDLHVPLGRAGLLVSAFALVYAVAAPITAVLSATFERTRVMQLGIGGFAVLNLAAALAPGYGALLGVRIAMAVFAGLYMGAAGAYAAQVVAAEQRGRALALVYAGFSVATVIGVPVGTWAGNAFGWRTTFGAIAVVSLIALAGLFTQKPAAPLLPAPSLRARLRLVTHPPILAALLTTTFTFAGAFSVYTYLASVLSHSFSLAPARIAGVLLLFGVFAVVGNALGGLLTDRRGARWVTLRAILGLGVAFGAMGLVASHAGTPGSVVVFLLLIALWGISGWAFTPAQQLVLVQMAPQAPPVAMSLNASATYFGMALGAFIGSLAVSRLSPVATLWAGAIFELLALAMALRQFQRTTHSTTPHPTSTTEMKKCP